MDAKYLNMLIAACVIGVAGFVLNIIISQAVKLYFERKSAQADEMARKRNTTIMFIMLKIIRYLIIFQVVMLILDLIPGIDTKTIIATLGVGGLAIGFGMQTLVKDVITGFFILWENQFAVGDFVKTAGYEGVIEEFDLRITKIRAVSGELCIIPNGKIETLANFSKGPTRFKAVLSIAYEADSKRALEAIEEVCGEIKSEFPNIVEGPTVLGISDLADSAVNITVVGKIAFPETFGVERAIKSKIKAKFDEQGIEIPYNKVQVIK